MRGDGDPGGEVAVGLEIPRTLQPALDRFLDSDGRPEDVAALVEADHWRSQDGNASRALLGVIERARVLRHAGRRLRVFFFDVAPGDRGDRDQSMAEHITAQAERNHEGVTLVLTGNLHARADIERWMSWHIARRHGDLVTLNVGYPGGSAYVCMMGGECGIHTGLRGVDRGATPFIERSAAFNASGYSGMFYLGAPVTASPPVKHDGPVSALPMPAQQ